MKKKWNWLSRFWESHKRMLLIMKNILLLVLVFNIQVSASLLSQHKVTLKLNGATLKECIKAIESQTKLGFLYNGRELSRVSDIDISVSDKEVGQVLNALLLENGYTFNIESGVILIKKTPAEINKDVNTKTIQENKLTVKGVVRDEQGECLPGVTVVIKGSTQGVITGFDGDYHFPNVPDDAILQFSFIGMASQDVPVAGKTTIDIILKSAVSELEDVTVVAFGKQKKESILSSIETIDVKDLNVPSSNMTTAFAGRMAGVISYQRTGEPGEDNAEFFIRGVTTFGTGKADPLVLIDNVELSTADLARLNPDDIQSFSILKDATATALYGARGANGVILVSTKEGVEGKAKFSFRVENSISEPTKNIKVADPITFMTLHNEAVRTRDPLGVLPYSQETIDRTIAGVSPTAYPTTDWMNLMFKDRTNNQRFNMNVSGGGKVAKYYLAASFKQDNGIIQNDGQNDFNSNIDLKKYLVRSNITINVTNSTKAVVRMHGTFDDYVGPMDGGAALYQKALRSNPVRFLPFYNADEKNKYADHILFGNDGTGDYLNPYADMVKGYRESSKTLVLSQIELDQELDFITEGLSARLLGNTTRYSYYDLSRAYKPFFYKLSGYDKINNTYSLMALNPENGHTHLTYDPGKKDITSSLYMELSTRYNRVFNDMHAVSAMLVYTAREFKNANAKEGLQASLPARNLGLAGRFTYAFNNKYFTEFNFGYNGSERFDKNNRYGFFPSGGLGYIISNEEFWKSSGISNIITKLKLKATYGKVGNDAIGRVQDRFFYLSQVNLSDDKKGTRFGRTPGYYKPGVSIQRYADPNITWEISYKQNYGIELSLFDDLELQLDYFRENRTNILMKRASIPTTMGLQSTPSGNIGEATGSGIDLSVDYQKSFANGMWLVARGNFTYAKSKFEVYEEPDYKDIPWRSHYGHSLGQQWGYVAERLFVDQAEINSSPVQQFGEYAAGDIKYKDINKDGLIDERDMVPIGFPTTPEIIYGFGVSFGYKNLDMSCFFQGSARSSFWIDPLTTAPFLDYNDAKIKWDNNVKTNTALLQAYADNHWSESNRDIYALWPRLSGHQIKNNMQRSTWFMRDGSFLRLKSAEIGYRINNGMTKGLGIENLRLYVSGSNLLTWSKFKLWDPEMGGNGVAYPVQRVYNIGLQVNF